MGLAVLTLAEVDWPPLLAAGRRAGVIRQVAEDFEVVEIASVEPAGEGEHLWVRVRKRGWTTEAVGQHLARWAGIPPRAVSWAGRKDRQAVTEQWFSLHLPGRADPDSSEGWPEGVELLAARRHSRRIRLGQHAGNRFRLRVRACDAAINEIGARLEALVEGGFPNYFGPQRFGRRGDNMLQARRWLLEGARVRGRGLRSILLSAVRSWLFNEVLAARVREGSWCVPAAGDVLMLEGSGSVFVHDPLAQGAEDVLDRVARGDLHVTGPLAGSGDGFAVGGAEAVVLARWEAWVRALSKQGVKMARRSFRVMPKEVDLEACEDGFRVSFTLPAGAYATSFIQELIQL